MFLHPFKNDIRSTFNGMIKYEGQSRNEREAGNGRTPQLESGIPHVGEQRFGVFDGRVNRESGEGPNLKERIRDTFLSRRIRARISG